MLLWASIFVTDASLLLHGSTYPVWVASLTPIVIELWRIIVRGTGAQPALSEPVLAD